MIVLLQRILYFLCKSGRSSTFLFLKFSDMMWVFYRLQLLIVCPLKASSSAFMQIKPYIPRKLSNNSLVSIFCCISTYFLLSFLAHIATCSFTVETNIFVDSSQSALGLGSGGLVLPSQPPPDGFRYFLKLIQSTRDMVTKQTLRESRTNTWWNF